MAVCAFVVIYLGTCEHDRKMDGPGCDVAFIGRQKSSATLTEQRARGQKKTPAGMLDTSKEKGNFLGEDDEKSSPELRRMKLRFYWPIDRKVRRMKNEKKYPVRVPESNYQETETHIVKREIQFMKVESSLRKLFG
ncbi:hypothetical protein RUM44_007313 [Polyplax serrata]|uniref:Uncharacterized protein n=1 Tax=Polyplax serrata TaxID=468196 RepID=A0ABR1B0C1_POLSC